MILYFSAEGNSQYAAKAIAAATNDQVFSIRKAIAGNNYEIHVKENENIGLIAPVYFHYLPEIVQDFLQKAVFIMEGNKHYSYFIATYGMEYGNICSAARSMLSDKGIHLDATYTIRMVDTWNPYFDMTDIDYIQKAEAGGEEELNTVIKKIKQHANEYVADTWTKEQQEETLAGYETARDTHLFAVDTAKCIGCGICVRQCPLQRIHLENKHPVWDGEKCTLCLGCVHRCPRNAISYTKDTIGHGQYINKKAGIIA